MKTPNNYIRAMRQATQAIFLIMTTYVGWKFYEFVYQFTDTAATHTVIRTPWVDAFLPIGGLMATKHFIIAGMVDPFHPAGMFIFLAILLTAAVAQKGFCGWICPLGTVSEYTWQVGQKIFGRNFRMPTKADYGLMSIKYLLMTLILFIILVAMLPSFAVLFFISDYYKVVDVKMLLLFTQITTVTSIVLATIMGLSLVYKNFWCRYLCPYGALLGLISMMNPFKIKRNEDNCINCGACSKHCPSLIDVKVQETVSSPECTGCLTCLSRCPEEGALGLSYKVFGKRGNLTRLWIYPLIIVAAFYIVVALAVATDNWHSRTPPSEYDRIIPSMLL